MKIVKFNTIPVFSNYFPMMPIIKITEADKIPGSMNEYRIPNPWNLNIIGVHKVFQNNNFYYGVYGSASYMPFNDPINGQIMNDMASATIAPILFDFMPPNKIRIRNNGSLSSASGYTVQIKVTQPTHLKGIDFGYYDEFLQLAYLDVLISLYPIRNRFSQLQTPYGVLQFFMDEVNSAKQRRDELIEKMENRYLNSGQVKKIWVM